MKGSISGKTVRAVDLAAQLAGASSWLTVLPIRGMNFDLNKSMFRDAVKLRYDWEIPAGYVLCLSLYFNVDHTMICKREDLSHNAKVNMRIWWRNCLAWCVKTLKSNQFSKTSQEKSCPGCAA